MRNSISHPKCFNTVTGRTDVLNNYDSINKSLDLLLCTSKGELFGDPNFGTNIMKYIYETNEYVLQDILSSEIIDAISKYEKRITVNKNDIYYKIDNLKLVIRILYKISNSNETNEYILEISKE